MFFLYYSDDEVYFNGEFKKFIPNIKDFEGTWSNGSVIMVFSENSFEYTNPNNEFNSTGTFQLKDNVISFIIGSQTVQKYLYSFDFQDILYLIGFDIFGFNYDAKYASLIIERQ